MRAPLEARVGTPRHRRHRRRLRAAKPRRLAPDRDHHHDDRGERRRRPPPGEGGRRLLRHLERLQCRRGAQARAQAPGAPVDRHYHQRHRPALLHDAALRRGQARGHPREGSPPRPLHGGAARPLPEDLGAHRVTISRREYDFQAARLRLESKPKSAGEKLTTIEEAVARVKDGDSLAFGGCLFSRTPLSLIRALLRRRPKGLTITRNLMCYEGEWCMVAGAVDKVVTSWMGIGLPWGLSKIVREYVESGRVPMEEWSHLALGLRFRAAAMGVPFLPSLTMLGSGLVDVGGSRTIDCPYTGEKLLAVPALFPDVAMLHVHRADRFGNCQIDGYPHMDADIAKAAATVLVTAEEIVPEEEIRLHPDRTVIPV